MMRRKLRQGKPRCNGSSGPMEGPLQCVEKASQSFAARRRRKKIKSFFRRRVRRKNTSREASVAWTAISGPKAQSAADPPWRKRRQPFSTVSKVRRGHPRRTFVLIRSVPLQMDLAAPPGPEGGGSSPGPAPGPGRTAGGGGRPAPGRRSPTTAAGAAGPSAPGQTGA